jgi:hypothetical protein
VSIASKQWTEDFIKSMAWTGLTEEDRLMTLFTRGERTVYQRAKAAGSRDPILDVVNYSEARVAKARAAAAKA